MSHAVEKPTPEWERRLASVAKTAFDRARDRQERETALAEKRNDLRHALRNIDERLKAVGISTHDPRLGEEREALLKHRSELWRELEQLDAGRSGPDPQARDRSFDRS